MKNVFLGLALLLGIVIPTAAPRAEQSASESGDPAENKQVRVAALQFLKVVDSRRFEDTWAYMGENLRATLTRDEWLKGLTDARKSSGAPASRELAVVSFYSELEDAPPGRYYVVRYASLFGSKYMEERVTLNKQGSEWKVEGYYILPIEPADS